jgi:modulator of drug activity B
MKEVLIVNAHQKYEGISEGRLNKTLAEQAKSFFREHNIRVLETVIDQGYDVDEEVEKHLKSDLVVLQTPINWANLLTTFFSMPYLITSSSVTRFCPATIRMMY